MIDEAIDSGRKQRLSSKQLLSGRMDERKKSLRWWWWTLINPCYQITLEGEWHRIKRMPSSLDDSIDYTKTDTKFIWQSQPVPLQRTPKSCHNDLVATQNYPLSFAELEETKDRRTWKTSPNRIFLWRLESFNNGKWTTDNKRCYWWYSQDLL